MLSKTLLAISALSAVALAAPEPGVGVNVVKQANYNEAEKAAKISLKEICYRNLYADVAKYKVKYAKEVLAKDAAGKAVFLFDGIKKDINNREFYYEEFCYKQFNIAEHNADVAKHNTAVVGGAAGLGGKGVYKRSAISVSSFDPESFSSGFGSLDGSYGCEFALVNACGAIIAPLGGVGSGIGYGGVGSGMGYGGIGKGAVDGYGAGIGGGYGGVGGGYGGVGGGYGGKGLVGGYGSNLGGGYGGLYGGEGLVGGSYGGVGTGAIAGGLGGYGVANLGYGGAGFEGYNAALGGNRFVGGYRE